MEEKPIRKNFEGSSIIPEEVKAAIKKMKKARHQDQIYITI